MIDKTQYLLHVYMTEIAFCHAKNFYIFEKNLKSHKKKQNCHEYEGCSLLDFQSEPVNS